MPAIKLDPIFFNHDAQAGGFFPFTHINPGFDIEATISEPGRNLLIEGIRGTGKTHILKMISSICIDSYTDKRVLPIYISLSRVSEWEGRDIQLFRIQLYANIVKQTITTIEKEKAKITFNKSDFEKTLDKIKHMFGIEVRGDIDTIL